MSAATLGLEWTKTSLVSVRMRLQAETDALMKSMKSICGEDKNGAVGQLRHRGVLLKDQHKLLSTLFKRFKLQVKKIQQLCHGDGGHWLSEVEMSHSADDDWLSSQDTLMTTSLLTGDAVLCKKRVGTCENTAVNNSEYSSLAFSRHNHHFTVTPISQITSLHSLGKKVLDTTNMTNWTLCELTECRATCSMSVRTETVTEGLDACHQRAECGANEDGNCWATRRQAQSPRSLLLSYQQTDAFYPRLAASRPTSAMTTTTVSPGHAGMVTCSQTDAFYPRLATSRPTSAMTSVSPGHTGMVTCSHVDMASDCGHDDTMSVDMIRQVSVSKEMSTVVTVPCTTVTAAVAATTTTSGGGSVLSLPSLSSLPVHDSLPASQPLCQFTEASVKKLRLPPPSPSLLSMSSGSPPLSPLPPVTHPCSSSVSRHPPPQHLAATHVKLPISQQLPHYLQQTAGTSSLPNYSVLTCASVTGPPRKVFVINSVRDSIGLPVPTTTPAVAQFAAGDMSVSQCLQKSVRPAFSLRQLIIDGVLDPGHNVLSIKNLVIVYSLVTLQF